MHACIQVCDTSARKDFPAEPAKATPAQTAAARASMSECYVKCFRAAAADLPKTEKKLYE